MKSLCRWILGGLLLGLPLSAQAQTAPCTGSAYTTNAEFFRASASGQSSDATASKKKALSAARTALLGQVQAQAERALTSQSGFGDAERAAFIGLIRRTALQEGAHLKVVCEDCRPKGGRYHTTLVVELPKAHVLQTLQEQLKSEAGLKDKFDAGGFQKAF